MTHSRKAAMPRTYDEFDQSEPQFEPQPDSPPEPPGSIPLEPLCALFRDQLTACLEECAHGRIGLFGSRADSITPWPEADQLRQLAMALQPLLAQQSHAWPEAGSADAAPDPSLLLINQFLDLCSIHGEAHPGEPRLARDFLRELANPTPPPAETSRPW